ncbi:DUF924 family protein [Aliamphritea ceti]|uniref:DUF924 family protein n=1 Tax=Aliamphritea ceti TaxID=1524258 RepID=UPI0021C350F9|nr:DUF924 family protein [Aliamphritea ceti]
MTEKIEEILHFWFGDLCDGLATKDRKKLWWFGGEEVDNLIRDAFGQRVRQALAGELDDWARQPRGRLALIILLDQFSRNIYRGSGEAFSGDSKAASLTKEGIELGHDRALELSEKLFFYMPLEHAESLNEQDQHIACLESMFGELGIEHRQVLDNALDFAHEHRELIARFGRFPYRNTVLNRESTPEELAYLNQPHKTYGQ